MLDAGGGEDGGVVGVRAVEPHLTRRMAYACMSYTFMHQCMPGSLDGRKQTALICVYVCVGLRAFEDSLSSDACMRAHTHRFHEKTPILSQAHSGAAPSWRGQRLVVFPAAHRKRLENAYG